MPNLGSSTAPSWAGFSYHGHGEAMAAGYTTPNFDILVLEIHAYFAPRSSTNPHGHLMIWRRTSGSEIILADADIGTLANDNGTLTAGIGDWHSHTFISQPIIAANTPIWIGAYCDQSLEYSTYDTNPVTFEMAMGGPGLGPTNFTGASNTGQGPCGGYIVYSQIVKAPVANMGNADAGLLIQTSGNILKGGATLADRAGGLSVPTTAVFGNRTISPGGSGGIAPISTALHAPKLRIWRPL